MSDWTAGYVADIGYTFGYYGELNPLRAKLALLTAGIQPPEFGAACELGFGQGVSVNLHAAASVTRWYGTDFNPSQAAFAQQMARTSGADAHLYDESFAEFCNRPDLPEFDYIGLHGIWSWISDENRRTIVDFIRRKLKVGGVLYISYNTQPGWAAMVPMRDLLTEHSEVMGAAGHGIVPRIDAALQFAEQLLATNPTYARANPQVIERVKRIKDQPKNYVAHEYFNKDWHPMSFSKMAEWLAPTKLSFACSAGYLDLSDTINLSPEQQKLISEIPDPMFRQTVRDFCVNQQFRRDYWIKGPVRKSAVAQIEAVRGQRVVLSTPRSKVTLKVQGALGEAELHKEVYEPILNFLSDHKVHSIHEIEKAVAASGIKYAQVLQAIVILNGAGYVSAAQDEPTIAKAAARTKTLNASILDMARGSTEMSYMASPVTGGGFLVSPFAQLFLLARANGMQKPEEWANFAWSAVSGRGQKLVKEGKSIDTVEANVAELLSQAQALHDFDLPVLKALKIVQ